MMPMAVPNNWPREEGHRQNVMAAPHQYDQTYHDQPYPHPYKRQPPPFPAPVGNPRPPQIPRALAPGFGPGAPGGVPGLVPTNSLSAPPTPTTPSYAGPDPMSRPFPTSNSRPPPGRNARPPPPLAYTPPVPPSTSRWDSLQGPNASPLAPVGSSPTSPRFAPYGAPPPPGPVMRSRPTTPSQQDVTAPTDPYGDASSRPLTLTSNSSHPDLRSPPQDSNGTGVENFSRPRKQSIRQPVPDTPGRTRPPLLPTPSEEGPQMLQGGVPGPWQRPRRPSVSSNVSSSTWAPGYSPTASEFPDSRTGPPRVRNAGPPPVSSNRSQFGYGGRVDSLGSAPGMGGATVPWAGGDELRSSFRSQLTTSSAHGTANTERSSVLTKDSSTTSFDANHDVHDEAEEPSLEDVMGMYEKGFDDDHPEDDFEGAGSEYYSYPASTASIGPTPQSSAPAQPALEAERPSDRIPPAPALSPLDNERSSDPIPPPAPAASRLDAEIRQSKMIFTSPAFMASVPHLATSMKDDDEDTERRDSGKSTMSGASTQPPPTIGHQQYDAIGASHSPKHSAAETIKRDSMSPTTASSVQDDVTEPSPPPSATPSTSKYPAPSPPALPDLIEPELPGSRDRYGFKKESQYISRKQYDNWDKKYSDYLARRKKKWTAFLKENSLMTDAPNRFPSPGPKTKKFVRKGIPPEWRGAAWFYYAGGPAILAKHGGLYEKLLHKKAKRIDVEAIERDLHRTFPDNINFRPPGTPAVDTSDHKIIDEDDRVQPKPEEPPIISSLRRVLFAFSIYNQNIGYCQSLNFIAGMLLLFVDTEEQCFWLLNVITHIYLPGTHELSLEGSKVDLGVLMAEIRDTMPAVWDRIGGELEGQPGSRPSTSRSLRRPKLRRRVDQDSLTTERLPPITMCMTAWFMSCFIGTLPIETTLRVWDIFFYEGSKTLFRMALAIFKTGESQILSVADPMEMFGVVQSMPRKMIDANGLVETCFKRRNGFGHLSQGAIDERRQEQRGRSQHGESGCHVTDGEPEVRRKGTLFRRKKRDQSRPRTATEA